MKRLYLAAAVVGLWPGAPRAQEGLAPTAPMVPAPVLKDGRVQTPVGGWGSADGRALPTQKWSPFRNPATASSVEPVSANYPAAAPALPVGITNPAECGPTGCGAHGRDRSCWERMKTFLCFGYTSGGPPRCQPTPFVTPLAGMFPCTPVGPSGCASGCAPAAAPVPVHHAPAMPAYAMPGVPVGRATPSVPTAGAVAMPSRGAPSPVQPTWQGRVAPESAVAVKPAAPVPALKPAAAPSGVVPTGFKYPAPAPNK